MNNCGSCKYFEERPTAAIAADGECTWAKDKPAYWLSAALPEGAPVYVDFTDGTDCKAWTAKRQPLRKGRSYTRDDSE